MGIQRRIFLPAALLATLLWADRLWAATAPSAAGTGPTAAAEQVWLLSTRCGGCGDCGNAVTYYLWDGSSQWLPADAAAFAAADKADVPTTFFIHGNRTDANEAVQMGWQVYQQIRCLGGGRPLRFVIWSWPADRIRGPLNDVRTKACRSDVEAVLLGRTVSAIQPAVRVNFIGFSFGARAITGALHLLGGGTLDGCVLEKAGPRAPMRAMLLAAALDADWLLPGHRHDKALIHAEQVLITCNGSDPALSHYSMIYGSRRGPDALGYAGPACASMLGDELRKLELVNVSCEVGRNHDWDLYFCAGSVQSRLGWYSEVQLPAATARGIPASGDDRPKQQAKASDKQVVAAAAAD